MDYTKITDFLMLNGAGLIWFIISVLVFYLFKTLLLIRLVKMSEKTSNDLDDLFVNLLRSISLPFAVTLSFVVSMIAVNSQMISSDLVVGLSILVGTYQMTRFVKIVFSYVARKTLNDQTVSSVQGLKTIVNILVWITGILFLFSMLGYNVSSIVAGLGIGGIAVALAVQNILGDILSSFSLYFDKPFLVGDYIVTDGGEGEVRQIGLKTTRLQSPRGEEIVISNRSLTEKSIQNFGKLERRRVLDLISVDYNTKNEKLDKIKSEIPSIANEINLIDFERFYFKEFGESALIFEFVYYINSANYQDFVNSKHEMNMQLKVLFEKNKVEMAFPTKTIHLKK